MKLRKIIAACCMSLVLAFGSAAPAIAGVIVVYEYGQNKFSTLELSQIRYDGYGQITGSTWYNSGTKWTYKGMVQYKRGSSFIGGPSYTPAACNQTENKKRTIDLWVWDSLDPKAPKTVFGYDYYLANRGQTVC